MGCKVESKSGMWDDRNVNDEMWDKNIFMGEGFFNCYLILIVGFRIKNIL